MFLTKEQVQETLKDVIGQNLADALDEKGISEGILAAVLADLSSSGERVSISKNHMAALLVSTLAARFLSKIIMSQPIQDKAKEDAC
jgi:hypothetical protein